MLTRVFELLLEEQIHNEASQFMQGHIAPEGLVLLYDNMLMVGGRHTKEG